MNIQVSKPLFYACAGLIASGSNSYASSDSEVSALAGRISAAGFPSGLTAWFARARTGQVAVNPYWPRGSALAAACFFVDDSYRFDSQAFFAFLEDTGGIADPIGLQDFKSWILQLPTMLLQLDAFPASAPLWNEYCRIVTVRRHKWQIQLNQASQAAAGFFGAAAPEMEFSPNLFTPYSADFVRTGSRIITIAAHPDAETMLHETLHTAVAAHREPIAAFAKTHGLCAFACKSKIVGLGYLGNDSPASVTHVIEECFVRALAAMLAGEGPERLRFHAECGFSSVPLIAARSGEQKTTCATLGPLLHTVMAELRPSR